MLQGSGQIRFSDIINEFGRADASSPVSPGGGVSLGRYRVSETYGEMTNLPLDTGIPQGNSQISFSNFHGKQLNTVVNYYHGGTETRVRTRNRYNNGPGNGRVNVIGGFRSKPNDPRGTRVIIHVNHKIGSTYDGSAGLKCAMVINRGWGTGTNLDVWVGTQGKIYGAGGNGGTGKSRNYTGSGDGKRGSSGLGVAAAIDLWNYGIIAGGGGGGAGGNREYVRKDTRGRFRCGWWCEGRNRRRRRARAGGGGGGGGQGSHVHNPATDGHHGPSTGGGGQRGNRGTFDSRGTGGSGGDDRGRARGGDGGNGGYLGQDGQGASGGQGGHAGRSIIIEGPGHGAQRGHITYRHQGDLRGPVQDHHLGDGDRNDS